MIILPTSQAVHIAEKMKKKYTEFDYISLGTNKDGKREFADREQYTTVRDIEKIDGQDVVVMHSAGSRPNSSTISLYQTLDSLNNPQYSEGKKTIDGEEVKIYRPLGVKTKSIQVLFLYAPQCKQDWPDQTGSINAAKQVLDISKFYGTRRFFQVDVHYEAEPWTKDYDLVHTTVIDLLEEKSLADDYKDCVDVGADGGMARRAKERGKDLLALKKTRISNYETIVECPLFVRQAVMGKRVKVFDDLIGTGGTMRKAARALKECGAEELIAVIPHLRLEEGYSAIEPLFKAIYVSNSIDNPYTIRNGVDVTDRVAKTLLEHG